MSDLNDTTLTRFPFPSHRTQIYSRHRHPVPTILDDSRIAHNNMQQSMRCRNCGNIGHTYKMCKNPIMSMGIICFKKDPDDNIIKYLLVQRRQSIGYIDIIRGRYGLNDIEFIERLITDMSAQEQHMLLYQSFDSLYSQLNHINVTKLIPGSRPYIDFIETERKINTLKNGYTVDDKKITLDQLIHDNPPCRDGTEWGFPKGHRRRPIENDIDCAIREFNEETNYIFDDYNIIITIPPIPEEFIGMNRKKYLYIYYLAMLHTDKLPYIDSQKKTQIYEIGDIGWFSYDECLKKINPYIRPRKIEILNSINSAIGGFITDQSVKDT